MTMMILDGVLILVIGWGVMYAWKTSTAMQAVKDEMKPVTRQLGSYLNVIGQHLQQLRETTESNRRALTEQLPQAKILREDFEVLLDHGNRLAERLDTLLEQAYAIERDLRAANTAVAAAAGQVDLPSNQVQTPIMREDILHRPYGDVMRQTPAHSGPLAPFSTPQSFDSMLSQRVYSPPMEASSPSYGPPVQQVPYDLPVDQLEAARAQAMQTRGEVVNRLRAVRI